jgi:ParB family chromosome partitioning protein
MKARTATFERILDNAPATFSATQLRVFLRALVNLDPYTFTDDVAEHFAGDDENHNKSAEEILLEVVDGLTDDKLTGFALRLVLTGSTPIPRDGEADSLTDAAAAFIPAKPKKKADKTTKAPTPIKASTKKATTKKQIAA